MPNGLIDEEGIEAMRDTDRLIGGLVMETYLPKAGARLLDVGASTVNGLLTGLSPHVAEFVGVVLRAQERGGAVLDNNPAWMAPDDHFDLVIAPMVFATDGSFWNTFLEMGRKARFGGHLYVSAPSGEPMEADSTGTWRFLPDAGIALAAWACSEGIELSLAESFCTPGKAASSSMFHAVFRRGPCDEAPGDHFVHEKVATIQAYDWRSLPEPPPVSLGQNGLRLRDQSEQLAALRRELEREREDKAAIKRSAALQIDELVGQNVAIEQRLQDRFREIAGLTRLLQDREKGIVRERAQSDWLRQVIAVMMRGYSRSFKVRFAAWLPTYFSHKRQRSRLKKKGLFDAEAYTAVYPDVSRSDIEPLLHYVVHGMKEGRAKGKGAQAW